jgi:hypothetical protein
VDSTFKGCTSLVGDVVLSSNYSGPFVLNGITNLAGSLDATAANIHNNNNGQNWTPNLTSIVLPDLLFLDTLALSRLPALLSVSAPKATNITSIDIGSAGNTSFDFSALREGGSIFMVGTFFK